MTRMRAALALCLVACGGSSDKPAIDAGNSFNDIDAIVPVRNMCPNTANVLLDSRVDFPTGMAPYGVAVADLNGDGLNDVITAESDSGGAGVLLNNAPGCMAGLAAVYELPTGQGVHSVAVADFNGDGKPDLAVQSQLFDKVTVLLNATDKGSTSLKFPAPFDFTGGSNPDGLALGDISGDGFADIVSTAPGMVSILVNVTAFADTTPAFTDPITLAHDGMTYGVVLADFDSDGRLDIAVTDNEHDTVSVYLNTTGNGTVGFAAAKTFATGKGPFGIAVGDLDGDHKPDLVVTDIDADSVSVLLNTTSGDLSFAAHQDLVTGMRPYAVAVGDLNRDGTRDIVVANQTDNSISVLLQNGGAWNPKIDVPVLGSPEGVALGDLDGDDALDVIVTSSSGDRVSVLLAR